MKLTWLGHTSIKIETESSKIYIDPYAGEDDLYEAADLILISKFDYDHCNSRYVRKMIIDDTKIIGNKGVASHFYPCTAIEPGQSVKHKDVEVIGMPVLDHRTKQPIDARGFLIIAEGKRIYYMADSDFEKEMEKADPDVLLISVGGTWTHNEDEAARIADFLKPELVIPIHWGKREGTFDDAALFAELTKAPTKVLQEGESIEL